MLMGHVAKEQLLCREACKGSGFTILGEWRIRGHCIHGAHGPEHEAPLSAGLNLTRGNCKMSQYELRGRKTIGVTSMAERWYRWSSNVPVITAQHATKAASAYGHIPVSAARRH